jgi:hypothetical protein
MMAMTRAMLVVKRKLAGETDVLGENLPQCHFIHHEVNMTWPRMELWPLR